MWNYLFCPWQKGAVRDISLLLDEALCQLGTTKSMMALVKLIKANQDEE